MKKQVLIADANAAFRNGLLAALEKSNQFEVIGVATDGGEAIDMVKRLKPDLLVLDLLLTKYDGIGVLREIYNVEKRPVVIAVSTFITAYVAENSAALGARYLMLKPLDMSSLVERMEECFVTVVTPKKVEKADWHAFEILVADTLRNIGVPAHIKGYYYLREAILLAATQEDGVNTTPKCRYNEVAKRFNTTSTRVERAIRHAVEVAWDRGDLDTLKRFFGYTVSNIKGKPTSMEFISLIANQIRLWMKEKAAQKD